MANYGSPQALWFLAGLAFGTVTVLLTAPRTGRGYQLYARGREAKDVARDAAGVLRRSKRLKRPLSES